MTMGNLLGGCLSHGGTEMVYQHSWGRAGRWSERPYRCQSPAVAVAASNKERGKKEKEKE